MVVFIVQTSKALVFLVLPAIFSPSVVCFCTPQYIFLSADSLRLDQEQKSSIKTKKIFIIIIPTQASLQFELVIPDTFLKRA
jgi:hypothetical protein